MVRKPGSGKSRGGGDGRAVALGGAAWMERIVAGLTGPDRDPAPMVEALEGLDEEKVARAGYMAVMDGVRKLENKEAVVEVFKRSIDESPPSGPAAGEPLDKDFYAQFCLAAEKAASERTRRLLGMILAEKVRHPESFSLATLQVVSVLDQELADSIITARPWFHQKHCAIDIPAFHEGQKYRAILLLRERGLVRENTVDDRIRLANDGGAAVVYADRKAIVIKGRPGATIKAPALSLTSTGQQLFSLMAQEADEAICEAAAEALRGIDGVERVSVEDGHLNRQGQFVLSRAAGGRAAGRG